MIVEESGKQLFYRRSWKKISKLFILWLKKKRVEINLRELTQTIGVFFKQPLSFDSYQQLFQYLVDQKTKNNFNDKRIYLFIKR